MGTFRFYLGIKLGIYGYPSTLIFPWYHHLLLNLNLEYTVAPV